MQERIDTTVYTPEQFIQDLRFTANTIQADFCERTTQRMLEVFAPEFRNCVLQWKTTSRPGDALSYRFFYNGPEDLTERAQEAGLLAATPSPLNTLQREALATFPHAMRSGIDFDAAHGLAKEWTFTGAPIPVEEIFCLRSLPDGFRQHAGFFRQYGLRHVGFLASDYQKRSMNVYFRWDEANRNTEWLQRIVCATGGAPLPRETVQDILLSQAHLSGVGVTFALDQPELLRWCVYSLEVPYAEGDASPVRLPALPERLATFREKAPSLNACPSYHMGWSFGPAGAYVKLEKNYARDASFFFTTEMGADLSHSLPDTNRP